MGYVNKDVVANKYYLLVNPLTKGTAPGANVVTNVIILNDTFDQTVLYAYEGGIVKPVDTYFAGYGWAEGTAELTPGKAFYLYPKAAGTITFVGEVTLTSTKSLTTGYNMVGSAYPAEMTLKDLGLLGQELDTIDIVYRYITATGKFNLISYFKGYGWVDDANPEGDVKGPKLNVGEGIWYFNAGPAAIDWKQTFTVQ